MGANPSTQRPQHTMCVLPAYMSCIRWSLTPPPKNLGSFPRASQHTSCVAVSVHVFLPLSRLAAIFSNRPQQTAGVSGSRARRTRRKKNANANARTHMQTHANAPPTRRSSPRSDPTRTHTQTNANAPPHERTRKRTHAQTHANERKR